QSKRPCRSWNQTSSTPSTTRPCWTSERVGPPNQGTVRNARMDAPFAAGGGLSLLEAGARIVDRYIVQSRLGSGGMATVYHCIDATDGTPVAVKLLHGHLLADNQEVVERFKRES